MMVAEMVAEMVEKMDGWLVVAMVLMLVEKTADLKVA